MHDRGTAPPHQIKRNFRKSNIYRLARAASSACHIRNGFFFFFSTKVYVRCIKPLNAIFLLQELGGGRWWRRQAGIGGLSTPADPVPRIFGPWRYVRCCNRGVDLAANRSGKKKIEQIGKGFFGNSWRFSGFRRHRNHNPQVSGHTGVFSTAQNRYRKKKKRKKKNSQHIWPPALQHKILA